MMMAAPSSVARTGPLLMLVGLACGPWPLPAAAEPAGWQPDAGFVQLGLAEAARTHTAGAAWHWRWQKPWAGGQLGGYWEASFGRWASELADGRRSTAWVTQLGLTPVLRWTPEGSPWFAEAGIGVHLLMPVYRSQDKRFSTTFNFGDHLALGRRFGEQGQHEVALRLQHYSNASIRRPNPGENFLQLRYTRAW
jgi:hypothetical protein